jgi:hypothetical protein
VVTAYHMGSSTHKGIQVDYTEDLFITVEND